MSFAITCRGFLDRERDFALPMPQLAELEASAGCGVLALYRRLGAQEFRASDLGEIVRLGLIGAGEAPKEAARLAKVYVEDRPLMETVPLAFDILDARINGRAPVEEPAPAPVEEPAPAPVEAARPPAVDQVAPAPVEPPSDTPTAAPVVVDDILIHGIGSEQ